MCRAAFLISLCLLAGCQPGQMRDFSGLSVAQLRTKMIDRDPRVRFDAIFELGRRDGQAAEAIADLTARLVDEDVDVRRVTTQTIGIVLMSIDPPYDKETQAAITALQANADRDPAVKAGVRIALDVVAAKGK